jgi:regulatory protein
MPEHEALKTAKSQALKYLTYRDRSKKELTQYLEKKGHVLPIIEKALQYLSDKNYINDQRFAMEWGRWRVEVKKFGKIRLRHELSAKGVATDIIETTLQTLYHSNPEKDLALACANKKLATLHGLEPEKKMRRLAQYLQRKGFSADIVYETTLREADERDFLP